MKNNLLGGLAPAQFLRHYWQKKPLLIRQAFPGFQGIVNKKDLLALACHEEARSRLVTYADQQWDVAYGPFQKRDFTSLPAFWTLLVQDVNHFLPTAYDILQAFRFIPHARLDDLMISYAPDGAGVGAHVDSYDVFLLQGAGQRRWQIAKQKDVSVIPDMPLRVLQQFVPEEEWLLEPGDMLYLPPQYAHHGVAVGESMTYSIGFRAPSYQELTGAFLTYLEEHCHVDGRYTDPTLTVATQPAAITDAMLKQVTRVLKRIRFGEKDISEFLGCYLTEPKAHVFFAPANGTVDASQIRGGSQAVWCEAGLKTQLLFTAGSLYLNGESSRLPNRGKRILQQLANDRHIPPVTLPDGAVSDLFYEGYLSGYLHCRG